MGTGSNCTRLLTSLLCTAPKCPLRTAGVSLGKRVIPSPIDHSRKPHLQSRPGFLSMGGCVPPLLTLRGDLSLRGTFSTVQPMYLPHQGWPCLMTHQPRSRQGTFHFDSRDEQEEWTCRHEDSDNGHQCRQCGMLRVVGLLCYHCSACSSNTSTQTPARVFRGKVHIAW